MRRRLRHTMAAMAGILLAGSLLPAYAMTRVHLRNGAELVCDHQISQQGQVRLFLTAADDSYVDVAPGEILAQEKIRPSAPPPAALPVTGNAAAVLLPAAIPPDLAKLLAGAGAAHHLDPDLLASVVRAESGGHARVISRTGARGLMQLMPGTAADLGVRDSFAPEQNIAGGATYLDALLMYYHEDLALALAAYNAGPAAVNRYHGIPPYAETRRYVARVIHDYNRRKLRQARVPTQSPSAASVATILARP